MMFFRIIIIIFLITTSCKTIRHISPATSPTPSRTEYIATYSDIAIKEMRRTGIPASIKMAQAILESGNGTSVLAIRGNNHFGIKCHDWRGRTIYHDDDERNECFRRYNNPEESFYDHGDFLTGRPRYANLFKLDPYDYKAWARGLKASGYATNPNYDRLLIRIIEENELYKLDSELVIQAKASNLHGQAGEASNVSSPAARTRDSGSQTGSRQILTRNRINYIVAREGDTYKSITREIGLIPWELSRYNDIPVGSRIRPGNIIYLQPKRIRAEKGLDLHKVSEGETMHYISQLYGIRLNWLLRRNFMENGQEPSPGETIFLRRRNYR